MLKIKNTDVFQAPRARNCPLLPLPTKTGISQLSSVDSNMAARSVQTRQVNKCV